MTVYAADATEPNRFKLASTRTSQMNMTMPAAANPTSSIDQSTTLKPNSLPFGIVRARSRVMVLPAPRRVNVFGRQPSDFSCCSAALPVSLLAGRTANHILLKQVRNQGILRKIRLVQCVGAYDKRPTQANSIGALKNRPHDLDTRAHRQRPQRRRPDNSDQF